MIPLTLGHTVTWRMTIEREDSQPPFALFDAPQAVNVAASVGCEITSHGRTFSSLDVTVITSQGY